jgi:carbamoyl-phosphate synthase large subunit
MHLGENCQPGPGVATSLRKALGDQVAIIGLAYDVFDSGLHADGLLDDAFMVPYPSAGPAAYLERLLQIQDAVGLDVFIPGLDVELPVVQRIAPALAARGIRTCLPSADALGRRTKDQLPKLAASLGIRTPETIVVTDAAGLAAAGLELGYPLVVKGPFYEAEVTHGAAEAQAAFGKLAARWGLPLLAQRFVKGEEFDVIALGDGDGGCHGPVAMRKTVITKQGKAWGAVTIHDDELIDVARRVVGALRWRGGCEVELLRAPDGTPYLIEVNPRFPAWVYLATAAGVNLPHGLVELALGRPIPRFAPYRAGVFYVRHAVEACGELADLESLMAYGRTRRATLAALTASPESKAHG